MICNLKPADILNIRVILRTLVIIIVIVIFILLMVGFDVPVSLSTDL